MKFFSFVNFSSLLTLTTVQIFELLRKPNKIGNINAKYIELILKYSLRFVEIH